MVLGSRNLGLIVDLAEGGMKIRSLSPLQPGSTTFLQFEAAQNIIEATAKVIWTDARRHAGVEFISLSESATSSIRQSLTMSVTQERAWPLDSSGPTSAVNISSTLSSSSEPKPQRAPITEAEIRVILNHSASEGWGSEDQKKKVAALKQMALRSSGGFSRTFAFKTIAEHTSSLTEAHGTAIAISEGGKLICAASTGLAPDEGVSLEENSGLSAECVRLQDTIWCGNTHEDPRIDPALCAQLKLGSAIVLPVLQGGKLLGILEVFAPESHAFDVWDALLLRDIARVIAELITEVKDEKQVVMNTAVAAPVLRADPEAIPPSAAETASGEPECSAAASIQPQPADEPPLESSPRHLSAEKSPQAATGEHHTRGFGLLSRNVLVTFTTLAIVAAGWQLSIHFLASTIEQSTIRTSPPAPVPAVSRETPPAPPTSAKRVQVAKSRAEPPLVRTIGPAVRNAYLSNRPSSKQNRPKPYSENISQEAPSLSTLGVSSDTSATAAIADVPRPAASLAAPEQKASRTSRGTHIFLNGMSRGASGIRKALHKLKRGS